MIKETKIQYNNDTYIVMSAYSYDIMCKDKEIERLNKRNKEIYEGFMTTTQELCEATKEIERLKIDYQQANDIIVEQSKEIEILKENNENMQIEMARCWEKIDKAIEYIKLHEEKQYGLAYEYNLEDEEIKELLEILKGIDKE